MAYIHCHTCGWSQDDFYSVDGYNPAKSLKDWNEYLCGSRKEFLDKLFSDDAMFLKENGPLTTREVIAREYEKFAKRIRNMRWITWDQFKNDPHKICPACGVENLDVD